MKTICITAATSKLGKTTLVEKLLPRLKGWAACKVTACIPHGRQGCPRGKEDTCGVCSSLNENYVIEEDEKVIRQPGTDTGRYSEAGAAKVIWVKTKPEYIQEALEKVFAICRAYPGIIFEGNHVLEHVTPDVSAMLLSPKGLYKASAKDVKEKVDLFFPSGDYDTAVRELCSRI